MCRWTAVCVVIGTTAAILAGQGVFAGRHRWWRDPAIQRELALSPQQVQLLDTIFERDRPARIALYEKLARRDAALRRTIDAGEADDATVMRLSEEVETLRRQRNTRRTRMLLAMYRVLTPSQRAAFTGSQGSLPHSRR
jgi:Spy/CpxP family protein refolding chaperone